MIVSAPAFIPLKVVSGTTSRPNFREKYGIRSSATDRTVVPLVSGNIFCSEVARTSSSPQAVTRLNQLSGWFVTFMANPCDVKRWRI